MAEYQLPEILNRAIDSYVRSNMYIHIPAKVINVGDLTSLNVIDVLPCISDLHKDGTLVELPQVLDCPVMFPSAGGGLLSFPIEVGDTVMLQFTDRGLEEWKLSDGSQNIYHPRTRQHSSIADAVALPGLYTLKNHLKPHADDVELKFKGSHVKIYANGDIEANTETDILAIAGNDLTATVGNDLVADIANDVAATVGNNAVLGVTGNMTSTIGGDVLQTVTGNLTSTVQGAASVNATGVLNLSGSAINLTTPGIVTLSGGSIAMTGGASTMGVTPGGMNISTPALEVTAAAMTNNGTNVGDTHTHTVPQSSSGTQESQAPS